MRPSLFLSALLIATPAHAQQMADTAFHPTVAHPAFATNGALVRLDEAHHNFHTVAGRYAPFVALLRADGFRVEPNRAPLTDASLTGTRVLVIANATGGDTAEAPAFTRDEVHAVHAWVERGGSLLLIADHAPFGSAAAALAQAFGVVMGQGFARDTAPGRSTGGMSTFLRYTRDDGSLADHAITRGRSEAERVRTVVAFTGQSLVAPDGATVLLRMSPTAQERPTRADQFQDPNDRTAYTSIGGRAQGLALTVGKGRVVVLGEAAMLSAQRIVRPNQPDTFMGMNVPGTDDQQFCLNALRWLAGVL